MPATKYLEIRVNNQSVELGEIDNSDMVLNYLLEEPENFLSKQGAEAFNIAFPCTKNNDQIFNTFWNPDIEDNYAGVLSTGWAIVVPGTGHAVGDTFTIIGGSVFATGYISAVGGLGEVLSIVITSPGAGYVVGSVYVLNFSVHIGFVSVRFVGYDMGFSASPRSWMDILIYCNGTIPIFKGKCVLLDVTVTDKPEYYTIMAQGGTCDWLIDMQNLTLWDCVSTTPHNFDVATVEGSWTLFDSDEDHDYVYAPVRYRQPFGVNDDKLNIYSLRPSLSIYWMVIRAFRQFGYTVNSQFMNTSDYFRRFVLPWTWGDFFDINSQLVLGVSFKAAGQAFPTPGAMPAPDILFTGLQTNPLNTAWASEATVHGVTGYVFNFTEATTPTSFFNYFINDTNVPNGFDNFGLYSFDPVTGTCIWNFVPPPRFLPYLGSNVTVNFQLNLIIETDKRHVNPLSVWVEVTQVPLSGPTVVTTILITPVSDASASFVTLGSRLMPTLFTFSVPGVNAGDVLNFRIKYDLGDVSSDLFIFSSGWLDTNPIPSGANAWQYDAITNKWAYIKSPEAHQLVFSTFSMTGIQINLGSPVNFQYYDAFRNYNFTSMLGGLVELFNLEVQTDPINKVVTIEPMFGTTLPDATVIDGYFSTAKILDWTAKRDISKANKIALFNAMERQLDFSMKQDGSDGGQNIFAARYKGVYLNNVIKPKLNNTNIENGIIAGVPGASRYMLPDRFAKGNRQVSNRFFSSTMHYNHAPWQDIEFAHFGATPAPQLIAIIPENINDSSASAVTQTFEPKIAFYKGQSQSPTVIGGWYWEGDPALPYTPPTATRFNLPFMFAVNYMTGGDQDPVLTYSDQNIGGSQVQGLMTRYFLRRLAIMRNGQLYTPQMRLNLNDICNWEHMEAIKIDNAIYALIGINGYKPFDDDSNEVILWKIVSPQQVDLDNCYPSADSILNNTTILTQYDLRYAKCLLFMTDIPQVG